MIVFFIYSNSKEGNLPRCRFLSIVDSEKKAVNFCDKFNTLLEWKQNSSEKIIEKMNEFAEKHKEKVFGETIRIPRPKKSSVDPKGKLPPKKWIEKYLNPWREKNREFMGKKMDFDKLCDKHAEKLFVKELTALSKDDQEFFVKYVGSAAVGDEVDFSAFKLR